MKLFTLLFFVSSFLVGFSQSNYSGVYTERTICCTCELDLKPNNSFELNCTRHYQRPLIEKGKWVINSDTITLITDTSIEKLYILNEDELNRVWYDSLNVGHRSFWSNFLSQKSYHLNWSTSIEKSWKYFSRKGTVKHGEWKYYNKLGDLEKIDNYRRGKKRKTKPNNS